MHYLGQFLVEQGVITREQLEEGLRFQRERNRRIGEMAVEKGLLSPEAVRVICRAQRAEAGLFGDIAVREGRLTRKDLDQLLFFQKVHHIYLGEALLHLGHLDKERYGQLLRRYWALRDAGRVSLRYLHDRFPENRVFDGLVSALGLAVRRFAGEPLSVAGLGVPFALRDFPVRALLTGRLGGTRPFEAGIGLAEGLSGRILAGLAEVETRGGIEGFFVAAAHYTRELLGRMGLELACGRPSLGREIGAPVADRIHARLAAPSGEAGLALWLPEVAA